MRGHGRRQSFSIRFLGGPEWATRMTCREAGCAAEREGWVMVLDPANDAHARAATSIKDNSGRQFVELRSESAAGELQGRAGALGIVETAPLLAIIGRTPPGMLVFVFPPGQQCFRLHQDREVVFAHNQYIHQSPAGFNEDFNIEADRINRAIQRG